MDRDEGRGTIREREGGRWTEMKGDGQLGTERKVER